MIPEAAFASTMDVLTYREGIAELIVEAARTDTSIPQFKRQRLENRMTGGDGRRFARIRDRRRERLITRVAMELEDRGAVEVREDGVHAAVDLAAIIKIIQELLPILLMLLEIFGG